MAYTKIIPVKVNKNACIKYITNPDKTEHKTLVYTYGCTEKTADACFDIALSRCNSTRQDIKPNLAYHLIQSFPENEDISPEKAHELGMEYMEKLFNKQYAFVLSTHVDKGHIHNHFVICAASLDMTGRKINDDKALLNHIRLTSDKICKENGLSIIETKGKGKHYKEWIEDKNNPKGSNKTQLKKLIDDTIKIADSYNDFIEKIKANDIQITYGNSKKFGTVAKYIFPTSNKKPHTYRDYNLGERYTIEKIKERITAKNMYIQQKREERLEQKKSMTHIEKIIDKNTLKTSEMFEISDTVTPDNIGLIKWKKQQNSMLFSSIVNEANQKYGLSINEFSMRNTELKNDIKELKTSLNEINEKIKLLRFIIAQSQSYKNTKIYNTNYEKSNNKEHYFENHESKLLLYEEAKNQLNSIGIPLNNITDKYIDNLKFQLKEAENSFTETKNQTKKLEVELRDITKWQNSLNIYLGNKQTKNIEL